MDGFNHKMNNVVSALLIKIPLVGKPLGKLFIPEIKDKVATFQTKSLCQVLLPPVRTCSKELKPAMTTSTK